MNNKEIASKFDLLAKLMELHNENVFKIRSYANAYLSLRKLEGDITRLDKKALSELPGVGKAVSDKIEELLQTGNINTLKKYQDMTPEGIQEMLKIRGLGPKKVKQIWKEMGITSVGELLYACNENRLIEVKGFGLKTQVEIKSKIEYFLDSKGKYLFVHVEKAALDIEKQLKKLFPDDLISLTGQVRRKMQEICGIDIISTVTLEQALNKIPELEKDDLSGQMIYHNFPVKWEVCQNDQFYSQLFQTSASEAFIIEMNFTPGIFKDEYELFNIYQMDYVEPEYREMPETVQKAKSQKLPILIEETDIKGIIHNHSTYSDGLHSLQDMANYVHLHGFEYFVISDHSKSAFYANGLEEERVLMQFREIEALNTQYDNFRIFKGIESDILSDGSLDYPDEILDQFEIVIASIHSNLNMDMDKATQRLINAVENKYTRILGHPTGRLLLAREGYPIDHKKLIDACAANHVVIEVNANPQRLDIDWKWIDYALTKNVMFSINPDAHSKESIHYIRYGVLSSRKGGLTAENCLNTKSLPDFVTWVNRGK